MAINFTCPHCDHHSKIDDKFGGQTGPCVNCEQMVTIPLAPRRPLRDKQGGVAAATGISIAATVGIISVTLVCGFSAVMLFSWYMFRLGTGVMAPPVMAVTAAAPAVTASQNLKAIRSAMEKYHDDYGRFPPAVGLDADGEPAHSWRVYLLPYLDEDELYSRYNFDEPWNSPGNSKLHDEMPGVFRTEFDFGASVNASSFHVITGEGALMQPGESGKLSDCKGSGSDTILVVEVKGSSYNWLDPDALDIDDLQNVNSSETGDSIGSAEDDGGALVLMANGVTRRLQNIVDASQLRRMALVKEEPDASE